MAGTGLPRPCIEAGCTNMAAGGARCTGHTATKGAAKNRRRTTLTAAGAGRQLRQQTNRASVGTCAQCGRHYAADDLVVDHVVALADGGTDQPDNVQLLCHDDHDAKSTDEAAARRKRRSV